MFKILYFLNLFYNNKINLKNIEFGIKSMVDVWTYNINVIMKFYIKIYFLLGDGLFLYSQDYCTTV